MGNPNGFRTVLLIAPPMILVWGFAALIFILDRVSQGLLYSQGESNWRRGGREITLYGPTNDTSTEYDYIDVYLSVDNATILATLLVCIIAYFVSAIGTCAVWELRRVEGTASHQRKWSWFTIFANVILAGASFGVFGWASSVQANGKRWHSYEDVGNNFRSYTKETWACQINEYFPKQDWAGRTCSVARATRFMLLPLGISALLVIVCILILARDRGGFKWLIGGKGRYGGFENIYEMQPPTPGGPIMVRPMPQPMPQWRPQPMPQWAPQHIPQPILHPALQPKQQPPPQTQQPGAAYQGSVAYR